MNKKILILMAILLLFGVLTYQMLKLARMECSLCITFKQRQCSKAFGANEEEALNEAHRNACALLSSGVTEVMSCHQAHREEVACRKR